MASSPPTEPAPQLKTKQKRKRTTSRSPSVSVEYFESQMRKLQEQKPPVAEWVLRHLATISIQLIDTHRYQVAEKLETFILTQTSHYARCGLYIIDSICNQLFTTNPEMNDNPISAPQAVNVNKFLSTLDEMLPRLFYSFIKREKHRIVQLEPINEEDIKLSTRDHLWIQKLLRRWYQHHFFRDNTIMYIAEKLNIQRPTRNVQMKRKWKDFEESTGRPFGPPAKHKKLKMDILGCDQTRTIKLEQLPTEILLRIFSFLPLECLCHVAMANTLFNEICRDSFLWKSLRINPDMVVSVQRIFEWTESSWTHIQVLELPFCKQVDDDMLKNYIVHLSNLKQLDLKGCKIHSFGLLNNLIINNSRQLESLDISHIFMDVEETLDLEQCTKLQRLAGADNTLFTSELLSRVFEHCTDLTFLDVSCNSWLHSYLTKPSGRTLSSSLQELSYIVTCFSPPHITTLYTHLEGIAENFPSLRTLSMNYEASKKDNELKHIRIHTTDARVAVADNNLEMLKGIISQDPQQLQLHDVGKTSLLHNAIKKRNIEMVKYLCDSDLFIPKEDTMMWNVKWLMNLSKRLVFPSGRTIPITNNKQNCADFLALLRLLREMATYDRDLHCICMFCGNLIDKFAAKQSFLRYFFTKASVATRNFMTECYQRSNFRHIDTYINRNTSRDLTLEAARAEITRS